MVSSRMERNSYLSLSNLFWQSEKYLPKKAVCMVSYHIGTTPLLVDMVNCYWTSQFYHKSVRSCFILQQKESCIYAGSGVSQTPIFIKRERRYLNGGYRQN